MDAMPFPEVSEKWMNSIMEVAIGSGPNRITVGGQKTLPFLNFEGETPHRPVIAMEVLDIEPDDWDPTLTAPFGDALRDPAAWAKKCVGDFGADMICISLVGVHPDFGDLSPEHAVNVVTALAEAVSVPLIVWGCGVAEKDNTVMPAVAEALQGKNALLGTATTDNYMTLVAACQMGGHCLITQSPLDINIAKQVNILVSDSGFPMDRIVMYPTTGALGYGMEYAYSIQERGRLAALTGDKMLSTPVVCQVGAEVCRVKEAKAGLDEQPKWGQLEERGPMWEAMTASALLMSGADIMIMRHPKAAGVVKRLIDELMVR
ncbi:MAG: acetyl-CoA decarbonylase/synthase complex subunit delta [Candidatus Latescibacterota bacterium]